MTKEEFRASLYKTYISSGYQDPVLIQEYVQIAESFVFDKKKFTQADYRLLKKNITKD